LTSIWPTLYTIFLTQYQPHLVLLITQIVLTFRNSPSSLRKYSTKIFLKSFLNENKWSIIVYKNTLILLQHNRWKRKLLVRLSTMRLLHLINYLFPSNLLSFNFCHFCFFQIKWNNYRWLFNLSLIYFF